MSIIHHKKYFSHSYPSIPLPIYTILNQIQHPFCQLILNRQFYGQYSSEWIDKCWDQQTLGQTLVTTDKNSSQLMTPSLSLSANWMISLTSASEKCSPTLAAVFSNSDAPNTPDPVVSKASKTVWRVVSLLPSPPNPKISKKALKSISPVWPELLTTARIWPACASMFRARMVLINSSVETLPLPSQSNTLKTSFSLPTVSTSRFFFTYLVASKAGLDIRYLTYNKNYNFNDNYNRNIIS